MPSGGLIQVTTARCDPQGNAKEGRLAAYVRVRVKDNGVGMSRDVLKKISEPFFTTKGENGTGLGVPQVCAFIRQIGGHLKIDTNVGHGTIFDLFLPAVEGEESLPQFEAA